MGVGQGVAGVFGSPSPAHVPTHSTLTLTRIPLVGCSKDLVCPQDLLHCHRVALVVPLLLYAPSCTSKQRRSL